jgi:Flp pilus assembly pilin Flp
MKNRIHFRNKTRTSGQGLVEYAIIIALVALVSIVILAFVSMGINGNFGLICAVMGCERGIEDSRVLVFDTSYRENAPQCYYWWDRDITQFYVPFYSSFPIEALSAKNSKGQNMPIFVAAADDMGPPNYSGPGTPSSPVQRFKLVQDWPGDARGECPLSVVVQTGPEYENLTIMVDVFVTELGSPPAP